jgi:hypothetical protein
MGRPVYRGCKIGDVFIASGKATAVQCTHYLGCLSTG